MLLNKNASLLENLNYFILFYFIFYFYVYFVADYEKDMCVKSYLNIVLCFPTAVLDWKWYE